ncbi:hypothetical protein J1605_019581 [Eschrichtius robustus]|uniref:Uncharacterized protein n=1 Tax=Eschrichtius robustus TaxID=9764 RepID=A0AB34HIY0_ESCRO|nr:hypothetical protein J1605_019581 [Eschrichtius robustus]
MGAPALVLAKGGLDHTLSLRPGGQGRLRTRAEGPSGPIRTRLTGGHQEGRLVPSPLGSRTDSLTQPSGDPASSRQHLDTERPPERSSWAVRGTGLCLAPLSPSGPPPWASPAAPWGRSQESQPGPSSGVPSPPCGVHAEPSREAGRGGVAGGDLLGLWALLPAGLVLRWEAWVNQARPWLGLQGTAGATDPSTPTSSLRIWERVGPRGAWHIPLKIHTGHSHNSTNARCRAGVPAADGQMDPALRGPCPEF